MAMPVAQKHTTKEMSQDELQRTDPSGSGNLWGPDITDIECSRPAILPSQKP
jgi:hypothetical protein